jgi:hypothetical protein
MKWTRKNGQGFGGRRRPQRGPGVEPLVGVKEESPLYVGSAFFINFTVILHFLNSAVR